MLRRCWAGSQTDGIKTVVKRKRGKSVILSRRGGVEKRNCGDPDWHAMCNLTPKRTFTIISCLKSALLVAVNEYSICGSFVRDCWVRNKRRNAWQSCSELAETVLVREENYTAESLVIDGSLTLKKYILLGDKKQTTILC